MSNPDGPRGSPRHRRRHNIIPMFICPGAKDVPLTHAVFPYGYGFTEPRPCPIRDCCLWYSGHDLGGRTSIWDFPNEAILSGAFRNSPFFCAQFEPSAGRGG